MTAQTQDSPRSTPNPAVAFALGGLAGNNAHGAGFLQAALDRNVVPSMISCTSGQLMWVWQYLKLLDPETAPVVSPDGRLETRFQDELSKLTPLGLMLDVVPFMPLSLQLSLTRSMAGLSRQWPFARDFAWWWLFLYGKKDRYKPAFTTMGSDMLNNLQQAMQLFFRKISEGRVGEAFMFEAFAQIWTNRLAISDFKPEFFRSISETFRNSPIGIVFNSYDPKSGTEYLHANDRALEKLDCKLDTCSSYRKCTRYAEIDEDAVRDALWLYMYGFDGSVERQDGCYFRSMILSELCAPGIERIYAVRPLASTWSGPLPTTWVGGEDLKTEVGFHGGYIGERDKIDLINEVAEEERGILEQLESRGIEVPQDIRERLTRYHRIEVIPVDLEGQRGYFDYLFEDMAVFRKSKERGSAALRAVA